MAPPRCSTTSSARKPVRTLGSLSASRDCLSMRRWRSRRNSSCGAASGDYRKWRIAMARNGVSDCTRIYEQWHEFTKAREADKLIDLYADDAVLETPLVTAILDHKNEGVLHGR